MRPGTRALDRGRSTRRPGAVGPGPALPASPTRSRASTLDVEIARVGRRRRPRRARARRVRRAAAASSRAAATARCAQLAGRRRRRTAACSASCPLGLGQRLRPPPRDPPRRPRRRRRRCSRTGRVAPRRPRARAHRRRRDARGSRPSPTPASTPRRTAGRTRSPGRAARRSTCSPRCARSRPTDRRRVRVTVDDDVHRDRRVARRGRATRATYASGMMITPDAERRRRPARRVRRRRRVSRADFLRTFPSVFRGTHVAQPAGARSGAARTSTIEALDPARRGRAVGERRARRARCRRGSSRSPARSRVVVPAHRDYLTVSVPSMPCGAVPGDVAVEDVLPGLQVDLLRLRAAAAVGLELEARVRRRRTRGRGSRPSAVELDRGDARRRR